MENYICLDVLPAKYFENSTNLSIINGYFISISFFASNDIFIRH